MAWIFDWGEGGRGERGLDGGVGEGRRGGEGHGLERGSVWN